MGKTKYYYNRETCQYERVRLHWSAVVGYLISMSAAVVLISIGILILHSKFFTTETARALRSENAALTKHSAVMEARLVEVDGVLNTLKQQETLLRQKLFEETVPQTTRASLVPDDLLVASARQFRTALQEVRSASEELNRKATIRNQYFASEISISDEEVKRMMALPAIMPVAPSDVTKLSSGFGNRINPFHKGMYFHPGVDFAAPRGTPVVATAAGRVIHVSRSSIEAGYGNYIDIDHGYGIITRYAHLENINVNNGQRVGKGSVIGTVGSTGGSVAPHLHYEVIRNNQSVDPVDYFLQDIQAGVFYQLKSDSKQTNQSLD
jgi:murein DD-endopeptidase MepM/ murein hydrolase activator NlpD